MGKPGSLSYDIKKRDVNTKALLEKYCKNELDDAAFLKEAPNAEFYYSTLSDEQYHGGLKEDDSYLPLFVSEEDLREYYDEAGREDYPVMKKSFLYIVETAITANRESPVSYGLIIDPAKSRISFDASAIRPAFFTMLRENDHFLRYKDGYIIASIFLSAALALFLLFTIYTKVNMQKQNSGYTQISAYVSSVDQEDKEVYLLYKNKIYRFNNISKTDLSKYTAIMASGQPVEAYYLNGKIYPDKYSVGNDTPEAKVYFFFLFGTLLLIFLDGLYIGSCVEVRKREKVFDEEIKGKLVVGKGGPEWKT